MSMLDLIPWRSRQTHPVGKLRTGFDRLLEELFDDGPNLQLFSDGDAPRFVPSLELSENDSCFTVRAEIPGMDASDVELAFEHGHLILRGEKKEEKREEQDGAVRSECRYGRFERRLPFGDGVDPEQISARHDKGVLTIELPKTPEAKKRRVQIPINAS